MVWYAVLNKEGFVYDVFRRKDKAVKLQEEISKEEGNFPKIEGITKGTVEKALLYYLRKEMED